MRMKRYGVALATVMAVAVLPGWGQLDMSGLRGKLAGPAGAGDFTSEQAAGGLKEALGRGIGDAVSSTGRPGGYFDNPAIKILMPPKLARVEQAMRAVGMGAQVDSMVKSMNTAAEEAAPAARAILVQALQSMTITDAKGIALGGKTAGTEYFQRTATGEIEEAFRPIVERAMASTGVTTQSQSLLAHAPSVPFARTPSVDINQYVLDKSTAGLFTVMGQEEAKIRTDPAAQVTPLLKTVFGRR